MANEDKDKSKNGFTVGEIEGKVKQYGLEIALCIVFILSAIFTLVWGGGMLLWSILLTMIFAIIGALVPNSMHKITTHAMRFAYKEKVTGIIITVISALIAIFLPAIVFAVVGLIAGKSFSFDAQEHRSQKHASKNTSTKQDDEE